MSAADDARADERLVEAISDGAAPDWSVAGERRGARIDALRDLEKIAEFHRDLQRGAEPTATPEQWGDLKVLTRLGSGAHADVFRAWDPGLEREVALKLMRAGGDDTALLEEGRAAARVRHPNVVTVYGVDRRDGRVGIWMELLRGASVEQEVRARGAFDLATARRLGLEIGAALEAVHAAGVVHGDVKPANVVRADDGRFVLADFGLGSASGGRMLSGTPMYMAPERLAGGAATERGDLYSLGMVIEYALTARHPFPAQTLGELVEMARRGSSIPLTERRRDVPAAFARVITKAADPDPSVRFANARALVTALEDERLLQGIPWGRTIRGGLIGGVSAVALLWALRLWAPALLPPALRMPDFVRAPGTMHGGPAKSPPALVPPVSRPELQTIVDVVPYTVEASFLRRDARGATRLVAGDRLKPGDRLSLEMRVSRRAWVYVLDEDDRGERYLLFPQPRFDTANPLSADSTLVLPGAIGGKESAWRVTSAGGRETFLVVASPQPLAEIEAELGRLPAAEPGRPVEYARVGDATVERLRGVGGIVEVPATAAKPAPRSTAFDRFRSLAAKESDVQGVWVRAIVFENP